ncbi:MAG: hypothetical protein R2864_05410 [Syntrophotaleaceae bacterium]
MTPEAVHRLIEHCADEIVAGPYVQSAEQMLAVPAMVFARLHQCLFSVLDRLANDDESC